MGRRRARRPGCGQAGAFRHHRAPRAALSLPRRTVGPRRATDWLRADDRFGSNPHAAVHRCTALAASDPQDAGRRRPESRYIQNSQAPSLERPRESLVRRRGSSGRAGPAPDVLKITRFSNLGEFAFSTARTKSRREERAPSMRRACGERPDGRRSRGHRPRAPAPGRARFSFSEAGADPAPRPHWHSTTWRGAVGVISHRRTTERTSHRSTWLCTPCRPAHWRLVFFVRARLLLTIRNVSSPGRR